MSLLVLLLAAEAVPVDMDAPLSEREERVLEGLADDEGVFGHLMLNTSFGRAFRFNNPFRLETQLGDTERSVSLTAPYHEAGVSVAFGPPDGVRHGGTLRLTFALEGVGQQVFGFGYFASWRVSDRWLTYGRLGGALVTSPDTNLGAQAGLGVVFALTGAVGIDFQMVGDLYYGAASYDSVRTVFPILGGQGGLVLDWEVLP